MSKEIKITIPDTLTPAEEMALVFKKIRQKHLSGGASNRDILRIGDEINIIEPESVIRIIRRSTEKPIKFCSCPVCKTEYQQNTGVNYFTNYGGAIRKKEVCSSECATFMADNFPGRVSLKRNKLAPVRMFN